MGAGAHLLIQWRERPAIRVLLMGTLSRTCIHKRDPVVGTGSWEITVGYSPDRRTVPVPINFLCCSWSTSLTGDPNNENSERCGGGEVTHTCTLYWEVVLTQVVSLARTSVWIFLGPLEFGRLKSTVGKTPAFTAWLGSGLMIPIQTWVMV